MNKSPAFQFYPNDYLGSARVAEMTLEEEGAYLRAMLYCWNHGDLPADVERFARVIGKGCSTNVATNVQRMFQRSPNDDSRLIHHRLEEEREKQDRRRAQTAEAGRISAESRSKANKRSTDVPTNVADTLQQNGNPSSSSPSSSSKELTHTIAHADAWEGYDKPDTLQEVITFAEMRGFTKDVAERYWHKRRSTGWTKAHGNNQVPIKDWHSDFATQATYIRNDLAREMRPTGNVTAPPVDAVYQGPNVERIQQQIKKLT